LSYLVHVSTLNEVEEYHGAEGESKESTLVTWGACE